jgi:hypothetical protein
MGRYNYFKNRSAPNPPKNIFDQTIKERNNLNKEYPVEKYEK